MKSVIKSIIKYTSIVAVTAVVSIGGTIVYEIVKFGSLSADENGSYLDSKLDTVRAYIDSEYLYTDFDRKAMDEAAVKAYVEGLDEPYTHYYPKDEFDSYVSGVKDSYVGIGIVISVDEQAHKIIVVSPTEESPAYKAGILPGDYILAVDGKAFSGDEMNECVSAIKGGEAGTAVNITIERNGEEKQYAVMREEISSHSVETEMLEDNIAYVNISSFNTNDDNLDESTYTEFTEQVDELKKQGMEKMIIDLRDNPGGVLDVVCKIADYILPEGTITYTETRTGKRQTYKSDAKELDIPMVVLINGNSASASEILTGALKDYKRAEIVGEKSFGKGIVQTVIPFSDGSGMSMTIAKYYTPNGVCIHGEGISPDYEVSLPEKYRDGYASAVPREEDTQLDKALELLK